MYGDVVGHDSEDEEFLDRAEEFEKAYNFRFEVSPALQVAGCMMLGMGVPLQLQGQSRFGGLLAAAGALTCICPGIRGKSTPTTSGQGQHEAEAACVSEWFHSRSASPCLGCCCAGSVLGDTGKVDQSLMA